MTSCAASAVAGSARVAVARSDGSATWTTAGAAPSRVPTYAKLPAQSTADAACAEEVVVAGCSAAAGRPSAGWPSGRDVATRSARRSTASSSGGSLFAASR